VSTFSPCFDAQYIPQLARVDSEQYAVGVCTKDGQCWTWGDANVPFCIQSCSKPITYCMVCDNQCFFAPRFKSVERTIHTYIQYNSSFSQAQELLGTESVHEHVGREPSGGLFNMLRLSAPKANGKCLPHNPMINAGAIMCCSLVHGTLSQADRFDYVMKIWESLCGNQRPGFANATYLSERGTADRNFCLGYGMG
jgi:glutaminase